MKRYSLILLVLAGWGCQSTPQLTTSLQNIRELENDDTTIARAPSHDVVVDSLTIPILDISLGTGSALSGGEGNAVAALVCDPNLYDCRIDLVGNALQDLLSSLDEAVKTQTVQAGTYTSLMLATCWEDPEYTLDVQAKAQIDGQWWYTSQSGEMTQDASLYAPLSMQIGSCRNYSILDTPVVVEENDLTLNLYFDLRNLVQVGQGNDDKGTYCNVGYDEVPDIPFICLNYPNIAGHVGETPPTVERYIVRSTAEAEASMIVGLFFDPDTDLPVGGFDRNNFSEAEPFLLRGWQGFKRSYISEGVLRVTDYGNAPTNTIEGDGDFTMVDFPRLAIGADPVTINVFDRDGQEQDFDAVVERLD